MDSSSEDDDLTFTINKDYATKYSKWRQKEEFSKLKQRYGDVSSSSDSSSESEDENAEGLTAQQEKDWLRTLAALKSKDPKIYNKEFTFYHGEDDTENKEKTATAKPKTKKEKPMTVKDYERKVALEKGGILDDESDSDADSDEESKFHPPGYYEEQEAIRKSFKEAVESDSDEDFLQERRKTKEELEKEENEYIEWLKGQKAELADETTNQLVPLKEYWNNPALDASEKYLRDFILNKPYLDEDDEEIPTYEDIVNEEHLSEDEEEVEKQEDFENKYNFRFEQPDQDFIKAFPRTIQETVRRKENKRAEKRREVKERKQKAKEQKAQDLKRLKNLKKMEIIDKLDTLRHITGNPNVGFSEKDLEGDFDPAEYDAMMKKAFSEDYYDMEEDDAKPEWTEAEQFGLEVDEDWDHWEGAGTSVGTSAGAGEDQEEEYHEPHCEDPDFIMDADYDPSQTDRSHGMEGTSKKKKKKRSKFSQALETQKPTFNPEEKSFEEYFDEYYKLDFEDIIGDMPCRFKYRKVVSNDFGLDTEEVLAAEDKHLNAWVSLKKMSQYRTEEEEQIDIRKFKYKAKNIQKKLNVIPSLEEGWGKDTEQMQSKKKKKKKKRKNESNEEEPGMEHGLKRKRQDSANSAEMKTNPTAADNNSNVNISSDHSGIHSPETSKKKKIRKDNSSLFTAAEKAAVEEVESVDTLEMAKTQKSKKKKTELNLSDARLKAYGINPKKFKYTQHAKPAAAENLGIVNLEAGLSSEASEKSGKKKKRKKNKSNLPATAEKSASDKLESVDICDTAKPQKAKQKKKKQKLSDDRLKAYGINPKKFKYTQHAKVDT